MKPLDIAATAEASGTPVQKSYNDGPAGVALLGMVSEAEQGIAAKSAGLRQRAPNCRRVRFQSSSWISEPSIAAWRTPAASSASCSGFHSADASTCFRLSRWSNSSGSEIPKRRRVITGDVSHDVVYSNIVSQSAVAANDGEPVMFIFDRSSACAKMAARTSGE